MSDSAQVRFSTQIPPDFLPAGQSALHYFMGL